MKIVINRCFGGFELSEIAHERLIELGVRSFEDREEVGVAMENGFSDVYIYKTKDETWGKYFDSFNDYKNRTHSLLIQVIEELGDDASGRFGQLEIVDIPDDINWEIDDYDGIESIHEKHRSW